MRRILARAIEGFAATSADRLLIFGVLVATLFGFAFVWIATIENVLFIENGVGLLQNYGLFAAILGDAVLFFLTKKYFDCCRHIARHGQFGRNREVKRAAIELLAECRLRTDRRFAYLFFVLLGVLALAGNISLHAFGYVDRNWHGDVFDSLRHPYSFALNKIFSFYSWCVVFPICGYVALITTIRLSEMIAAIGKDHSIEYDLLHPDNAGGFASVQLATAYFNIGVVLAYLQIALYTVTFRSVNVHQLLAYGLTTFALLAANFMIFGRVDRAITEKKRAALAKTKDRAYQGDSLSFEIFRYYVDVFSRKSLQRRLSLAILSLKSAAIALPPILKGLHLLTS